MNENTAERVAAEPGWLPECSGKQRKATGQHGAKVTGSSETWISPQPREQMGFCTPQQSEKENRKKQTSLWLCRGLEQYSCCPPSAIPESRDLIRVPSVNHKWENRNRLEKTWIIRMKHYRSSSRRNFSTLPNAPSACFSLMHQTANRANNQASEKLSVFTQEFQFRFCQKQNTEVLHGYDYFSISFPPLWMLENFITSNATLFHKNTEIYCNIPASIKPLPP